MKLVFNKLDKEEWSIQFKKIGLDRKWLLSIYQEISNEYYSFGYKSSQDNFITVGACYFVKFELVIDCSFFIFPEYRRKGFARSFISELISKYDDIQFTVSLYNKPSVSLFESIPFLKKTIVNERNHTVVFNKN
jgi:hypothetical protein